MTDLFEKSIQILELPKVLERLAGQAVTQEGKERCLALRPMTDPDDVQRALDETSAAVEMSALRGSPSFSGVKPVAASLQRAHMGGALNTRELLDIAAVALYVYLISVDLNGGDWYLGLAAPIILWGGAILLLLGLVLRVYRRSALTTLTILIGSIGVFVFGMEFFVDRWLHQLWSPSWSLVVLTICIGMVIPLIIIRRVPALREEARRRFHL